MKYSVSSYSFSQLTSSGEYTEKELIGLAKEMGFDGIEFAGLNVPEGMDKLIYAALLKQEADKYEIPIVAYSVGADLLTDTDKEVIRLISEVEVAAALGAPVMRHDATCGYDKETRSQRGFANSLPQIIRGCKLITEYAKTKNVRTCVENHGFFCQDSARIEAIVNSVADDNFGVQVDIGNFLCADEDPAIAVGNLAPYAVNVHAKDFHVKKGTEFIPAEGFFMTRGGNYLRGAIIGHGDVPVLQCMRTLKNAGYNGNVTVEFEGVEDAKKGVAWGLSTLRHIEELL